MARRKASGYSVPSLKNVESGRTLFKEGEYRAKVAKLEPLEKKRGSEGGIWWYFEITEGQYEGKTIRMMTSFAENALWNIKGLLDALDYEIPDDDFDIDPDDVIDKELIISIGTREYEDSSGNMKKASQVENYMKIDEDDEPKKGKGKSKKAKDDEDEDEDDKPARGRRSKKDEDDDKPARGRGRGKSKDEDEDEDDEPKKGKASKGKSKKPKKVSEDDIENMDQDELVEFCEEHELDFDPDKYRSLRKMREAVIEMAQENDLFEE